MEWFLTVADVVWGLFVALIGLSFLVFVHEMGHYLLARYCGVFVYEFAVGFGPRVWFRRNPKSGTIWSLRCIPLGGFVRMLGSTGAENTQPSIPVGSEVYARVDDMGRVEALYLYDPREAGEGESDQEDSKWYVGVVQSVDFQDQMTISLDLQEQGVSSIRSFPVLIGARFYSDSEAEGLPVRIVPPHLRYDVKSRWKRFLILFAGPLFNFLLAVPLLLFFTGISDKNSLVFDEVAVDSPARAEGILPKDTLRKIGPFPVMGKSFSQNLYRDYWEKREPVVLRVEGADGQTRDVKMVLRQPQQEGGGKPFSFEEIMAGIGVTYSFQPQQTSGWLDVPKVGLAHTVWMARRSWDGIVRTLTKGVPLSGPKREGGGPIMVIKKLMAGSESFPHLLSVLASLSFALALVNLIPFIPLLDGGKIFLLLVEFIRRKPTTPKIEVFLVAFGALFLISWLIYVSIGDIMQLISG